tara:strand:+ start:83 stop:193 length:111 start_codon:yes stop_codon:yes gene_type:complete
MYGKPKMTMSKSMIKKPKVRKPVKVKKPVKTKKIGY